MKSQQGCLLGVRSSRGFTLIELMIVIVVISILAAIAIPNYQAYVLRSKRAAAAGFMLEVANAQERYLLDKRRYAADMATLGMTPPSDISGNYTVTVSDPGGTGLAYTITAAPTGSQTADTDCGTLSLTHQGVKSVTGSGTRCWK